MPKGTLVISGGGITPKVRARFIAAAGGTAKAKVVVIPTALGPILKTDRKFLRPDIHFRGLPPSQLKLVHAEYAKDADTKANLEALRNATGIWFTGGRQWRIVDGFEGTECLKLMHTVLQRGGVIGGGSAGATIQGEYLVRGDPLGNLNMMAEGYERGFAFLPGVAIDQHFAQRDRFKDLTAVKKRFPQLVGIGLDEFTAVVVRKSLMEVIGKGKAHLYNKLDGSYVSFADGKQIDLKTMKPAGSND